MCRGLEPLTEAEIIEMQMRSKKKKRVSNGFKIRRKNKKFRSKKNQTKTQLKSSHMDNSEDMLDLATPVPKPQEFGNEFENKELTKSLENLEGSDMESFEKEESRWVIPSGWKLVLYVKFWSNSLIETSDLFIFDSYEGIFNGFHRGFPLRVKGQTSFPSVDMNPSIIFTRTKESRGNRIIKNCFILNENLFEFGPLFITQSNNENTEEDSKSDLRKFSVFTFKNNTTFEVHISFTFLTLPVAVDPPKNNKKGNDTNLPSDAIDNGKQVFTLENSEIDILPGQSESIHIYATPFEEKVYNNSLICCIRENPLPLIIPLKCKGQYPRVTLNTKIIDFGKLLVGKVSVKQLVIKNITLLPIKWKIKTEFQEFDIDKLAGCLMADQEEIVNIRFEAKDQLKIEKDIEIEIEDNEDRQLINDELQILSLRAEGFFIKTELSGFDGPDNFFEFGDVQVAHEMEKQFKLENKGIYPIKYAVEILRKQFKNVFRIEPQKGVLEPEEEIDIRVIFCSSNEIYLRSKENRNEIVLKIIENNSGEVYEEHRLKLKVNSQFSQFNLNPLKSLNFSAIIFGETRTKYFQIQNTGLFDFHFNICEWKNRIQGKQDLQALIESGQVLETPNPKSIFLIFRFQIQKNSRSGQPTHQ
jgi:hydrocephalus-inducing protein